MKQINRSNWLEKDSLNNFYGMYRPRKQPDLTEAEEWVVDVMQPTLLDCVPTGVCNLFEAARGIVVYAYYFYPLHALGTQQLSRVAETATDVKYEALGGPKKVPKGKNNMMREATWEDKIDWLDKQGKLHPNIWHMLRKWRNSHSHPSFQELFGSKDSLMFIQRIAQMINGLFSEDPRLMLVIHDANEPANLPDDPWPPFEPDPIGTNTG